jgi:hypothetical protein
MFGFSDKVTLTLINGTNNDGCSIPFTLKLPVEDESFEIPEDLASVDVFEYQEGTVNNGVIVFSIFVGEKSTIDELIDIKDGIKLELRREIEIPGVTSPICYQVVDGKRKIFANVDDSDLVVSNHGELRTAILKLSNNYSEFCSSVQKVKCFGERYNKQ